jgi:hypothetical protein
MVGGAAVAIAAALLLTILWVARGIEREAARAREAARSIEANTGAILSLNDALETLETIRSRAEAIGEKTNALASVLHGGAEAPKAER